MGNCNSTFTCYFSQTSNLYQLRVTNLSDGLNEFKINEFARYVKSEDLGCKPNYTLTNVLREYLSFDFTNGPGQTYTFNEDYHIICYPNGSPSVSARIKVKDVWV